MSSIFYFKIAENLSEKEQNKASEILEERTNILSRLIETPFSISGIETDFSKNIGKMAVREITRNTVITLVWIFSFQLILTFFGLYKGLGFLNNCFWEFVLNPFCVAVWPYILFFVIRWAYLKIKRCEFNSVNKNVGNNQVLTKEYAKTLIQNSDWRNSLTKYFYKIIPFTFRTIWIWTLIFGIATVFTADDLNIDLHTKINSSTFNSLTSGLLKAIIITIISYIATNVIHELLQLREQYVEGLGEMKDLKEKIINSNENMISIVKQTNILKDQILSIVNYGNFTKSIKELIEQVDKKKLTSLGTVYSEELAKLSTVITSKMNDGNNEKKEIFLSLLSSYNCLLGNQVNRIHLDKPILTQWENLGTISKNLVDNIIKYTGKQDDKLVFYALQLKSPSEFVDDYFEPTKNNEWCEFINFNIINNKVKRYFAVIDDSERTRVVGILIKALQEYNINPEANLNILKKIPYVGELNSISESCVKKSLNENKHYRIDQVQIEKSIKNKLDSFKKPLIFDQSSQPDFKEITLQELLNNVIHKENFCKIRKFDKNELENLLIDNDEPTSHEKSTYKLIDYIAIREQNSKDNVEGEWLFCVKSIYDKDMDTAKVEYLFKKDNVEQNKTWEITKKKLNNIFFLGAENSNGKSCELKNDAGICNKEDYCKCENNALGRSMSINNFLNAKA